MPTKRQASASDWLPLAKLDKGSNDLPTGEAFRPEWIDFAHGIRVGNLEPHERITQIMKFHLERDYGTSFVMDRWGRGVYWQWICWLPRPNREAKPLSHNVNFGCAKLFISADQERRIFQSGLQIERGYAAEPAPYPGALLQPDWDWHRFSRQCARGTVLDRELQRLLVREGFVAEVGDWEANAVFTAANFKSATQLRSALKKFSPRRWAGFQLYYPMSAKEVGGCTGYDLVKAICAVFAEVIPVMNACMQVELTEKR